MLSTSIHPRELRENVHIVALRMRKRRSRSTRGRHRHHRYHRWKRQCSKSLSLWIGPVQPTQQANKALVKIAYLHEKQDLVRMSLGRVLAIIIAIIIAIMIAAMAVVTTVTVAGWSMEYCFNRYYASFASFVFVCPIDDCSWDLFICLLYILRSFLQSLVIITSFDTNCRTTNSTSALPFCAPSISFAFSNHYFTTRITTALNMASFVSVLFFSFFFW